MSDHLKRLNQDEKNAILRFLPRAKQASLRVLARHTYNCIEPLVATLVSHVARGKQTEAEVILACKPELAMECAAVTDYSGRVFAVISAFEYALLARDIHMLQRIIDSIPYTDVGTGIVEEFLRQFNRVMTEGITYTTAAGEQITESHLSLEPLKAAYRAFIAEDRNVYPGKLGRTLRVLWEKVGAQQYLLPAHVAQRYCNLDPYFVVLDGEEVVTDDYSAAQFQRSLTVQCREHGAEYKSWFDIRRLEARETISGTRLHSHIKRYTHYTSRCEHWRIYQLKIISNS